MAGFECACQRRADGVRLDLLAATRHDALVRQDYARIRAAGLRTAREGARWHLIEPSPGAYDFSSLLPMVRAAREAGIQVIWDLCHYGWPEHLDIWRPEFVDRFARYAAAVARTVAAETDEPPIWVPINEISFWSWGGGEQGCLDPHATGRGFELKAQLVRAALAAVHEVRAVDPRARILFAEPAVHILPHPERPERAAFAEGYRQAQYQAWDMIAGRLWPQLGGDESCLDLLGVNYYPQNQWVYEGPRIRRGDRRYRPFQDILREVHARYGRPIVVAETGAEGEERAPWLRYVGRETRAAIDSGVPVEGVCIYPILDYPGWDDDRHCPTGLWGFADEAGERPTYEPLAREIERQRELTAALRARDGEAVEAQMAGREGAGVRA
jgi:hypothetical protein